jgi:hypothetical protein
LVFSIAGAILALIIFVFNWLVLTLGLVGAIIVIALTLIGYPILLGKLVKAVAKTV